MNKLLKLISTSFIALSLSTSVNASDLEAKQELQAKLAKFDGFSAFFKQNVFAEDGEVLQQGQGQLKVKKPNLLYWKMESPEENLIVSDGQALWVFNPFIEQVSVYSLDNSTQNTPILLLSDTSEENWQHFEIEKLTSQKYVIQAKSDNSQVSSLTLSFNGDSIAEFSVVDATGQTSIFSLSNVTHTNLPENNFFIFTVPDGVDIDDQR